MKTVIELAREAGWKDLRDYDSEMRHDCFVGNTDSLENFAELVRTDEREACALMCEHMGIDGYGTLAIAAAIRARSST